MAANKYKSSTYVGLRHPMIAGNALSSSWSNMSAYVDPAHTGAACAAIEWHMASVSICSHFELDNLFKKLLRIATFILMFCMYRL